MSHLVVPPQHRSRFLTLPEIEDGVCDVLAKVQGRERGAVHAGLRLTQDLHCDSIEFLELILALEEHFGFGIPADDHDPIFKSLFTRPGLRLCDLAEIVYLAQHDRRERRIRLRSGAAVRGASPVAPFTQLSGVLREGDLRGGLYETIRVEKKLGPATTLLRRRTDGMLCVRVPAADDVVLGANCRDAWDDEMPEHRVRLSAFTIDIEPVSTTAYARFLNSIGPIDADVLRRWFVLQADDHRRAHELLEREHGDADGPWLPRGGTERLPMMLVSWFGANAYALWANGYDWRRYDDRPGAADASLLPSEAQWECAARGAASRQHPWRDAPPTPPSDARVAQHAPGATYTAASIPMAAVNESLGVSPLGLRHMSGNVWQWCRDWYAADFYRSPAASAADPVNRTASGVRSERGGSWVGPAALARASYRRGREPAAKGRCLGFRCIGDEAGTGTK